MAEVDATRACVVCGTLFARNGKVSLCSDECRTIRQRENERASALRNGYIKGPQQLTCAHCAAPFVGTANKTFCSVKCRGAERRKAPAYARDQAKWRNKNRDAIRARSNESKARIRAERGREDRSVEYERATRKRADESARLAGEYALTRITCIGCDRYAHVPALVARVARIIGKADAAARERIARARRPAGSGALSQHTINLKADRDRYAKDITRTRAKSYLRKTGKVMPDDGTASAAVLLGGSRCLYCDCPLTEDNRSHDHMTPLSLGGTHSAANIAPACKPCNFSKGKKAFEQFVNGLDARHRKRAVAFYEKRNGPMAQMGLMFAA